MIGDRKLIDIVPDMELELRDTFRTVQIQAMQEEETLFKQQEKFFERQEQAAENVLAALIDTQVDLKKSVEEQEAYDEEQFWKDYQVQLARAMPMWMPNWLNECLPGWCIQYQLYDRTTGDFLFSMVYCADALTGEVAYYQPNE